MKTYMDKLTTAAAAAAVVAWAGLMVWAFTAYGGC